MRPAFLKILFLGVLLIDACSKDLIMPLNSDNIAVVESYLYAGDSLIRVNISKPLPFSSDTNEVKEYIPGLTLQINGTTLTESEPGHYLLSLGKNGVQPGTAFTLKFRYADDTVSSSTDIPEIPINFAMSASVLYTNRITSSSGFVPGPMEDIDLTWYNEDESYFYVSIEYLEDSLDYINYNMADLDLSRIQGINPINSAGTRLGIRNLNFFGKYRVVLFKVNQEFVDLYQHLTSNSNNLTNPVTAIKNGYGIFTGMSSDTLSLEVKEN
jgi:hypothetical protein